MNLFTRIVCFVLLVAAMILVLFRAETATQTTSDLFDVYQKAEQISGDRFAFETRTRKGALVISTSSVSSDLANAVDKGLDDLFTIAKNKPYRYRKNLKHTDFVVFVGRPDRTKDAAGTYSPDIAVGAAQYAGTEYDKGGYIYASGMVISNTRSAFLIANHKEDFERVSRIVRFEGEHIVLYHNDRTRYRETMDHSRGGGHPILK